MQARAFYVIEEGGGQPLRQIQESWKTFKEKCRAGDIEGQKAAWAQHDNAVEQGATAADKWEEYYEIEERLDRMRQRTHKRMVDGQLLVKLDLVLSLLGIFVYAVKAIVRKELESVGQAGVARTISEQVERELKRLFGGNEFDGLFGKDEEADEPDAATDLIM
jgi:hypothetical protein